LIEITVHRVDKMLVGVGLVTSCGRKLVRAASLRDLASASHACPSQHQAHALVGASST